MDELVERCKADLRLTIAVLESDARVSELTDDELEALARGIIPIVADWQRERDAVKIDELVAAYENAKGKLPVPSLALDASIAAGEAFATAIRGAE